jgi:CheY-like chemotaxis protein
VPPIPRRVLIVEDDADTRQLMRLWLELDGHQVDEAQDGLEGLRAALQGAFDLAFIDLSLPRLSGYDVARKIRAAEAGRRISLVALTGRGLDRDRQDALDAGFDRFVLKPVGAEALNALLLDPPRRSS